MLVLRICQCLVDERIASLHLSASGATCCARGQWLAKATTLLYKKKKFEYVCVNVVAAGRGNCRGRCAIDGVR